jgi:membrane protein implicated in regulation of membrane protease activity
LGFGLAYFFTDQIKAILTDVHRVQRWLGLAGLLVLAVVLVVAAWRWSYRVEKACALEEPAETYAALP